MMGGQNTSGNAVNTIDFGIIANGGTFTDFGDLTAVRGSKTAQVSDSHGGLNDGYLGTRPPPVGSGRALVMGGSSPKVTAMDTFNINTLGNGTFLEI